MNTRLITLALLFLSLYFVNAAKDEVTCKKDSDCVPSDACQTGFCTKSGCYYEKQDNCKPYEVECFDDSQCDDKIDCTVDYCNMGIKKCYSIGEKSLCEDGSPCTINTCDLHSGCSSQHTSEGYTCSDRKCKDVSDCFDDDKCTQETCVAGFCEYPLTKQCKMARGIFDEVARSFDTTGGDTTGEWGTGDTTGDYTGDTDDNGSTGGGSTGTDDEGTDDGTDDGETPTTPEPEPEPAVPVLEQAVVEDNGIGLTITFDIDTDRAGKTSNFPCYQLLSTVNLGASTCAWADSATLRVLFAADTTIAIGDDIVLVDYKIRAAGVTKPKYASGSVTVSSPSNPVQPAAYITGPSTISSCDTFKLYSNIVSGTAGRPATFSWNSDSALSLGTSASISVDADDLTADTQYTFTLTVSNWLGQSVDFEHKVLVSSTPVPVVSITTHGPIVTYRSTPVRIEASAVPSSCAFSSGLSFRWSVSPSISGWTATTRDLVIPANTLEAGQTYTFTLSAFTTGDESTAVTASIDVEVAHSAPVALIAGGDRQVSAVSGFSLDASASYDADTGSSSGLSYAWTCSQLSGESCGVSLAADASVNVAANAISAGVYTFTVSVSKADGSASSASVRITAVATPVLDVFVSSAAGSVVNSKKRLTLTGSASKGNEPYTYEWTVESGSLVLNQNSVIGGTSSSALVVAQGLASGQSYKFRLTVTDSAGTSGYAEISITVNGKPSGGSVTVSPSSGVALTDSFTLEAPNWFDEDQPLEYQFFVVKTDGTESAVSTRQGSARATVTLAVGTFNYRVRVFDSRGEEAVANGAGAITVSAPSIENAVQFVNEYIANTVTLQLESGDVSAAALSILNLVASVPASGLDPNLIINLFVATAAQGCPASAEDAAIRAQVIGAVVNARPAAVSGETVSSASGYAGSLAACVKESLSSSGGVVSAETANQLVGALSALISAFNGNQGIARMRAVGPLDAVYAAILSLADTLLTNRVCGEAPVATSTSVLSLTTAILNGADLEASEFELGTDSSILFNSGLEDAVCYQTIIFASNANFGSSSIDSDSSVPKSIGGYTTILVSNAATGDVVNAGFNIVVPVNSNDYQSNLRTTRCVFRSDREDSWQDDDTCSLIERTASGASCQCSGSGEVTAYSFYGAPDCFGVPNGDAVEDICGVCGGQGDTCKDCKGVIGGDAKEDICGVCDGDGSTCCNGYNSINDDFWDYILLPESLDALIDRFQNTRSVLEWIQEKMPERSAIPSEMMEALGQLANVNKNFLQECALDEFCDDSKAFLKNLEKKPVNPDEEMCQS